MKRILGALLAASVLAACGGGARIAEPTRYDLGAAPAAGGTGRLPLAGIDVQAASWLSTTAMHYRLAYVEPLRRQGYNESRWAAPPAELLESLLKRRLGQSDASGPACRLQLALDEFEQRFDDAQSSQVVVEVRATLMPARGGDMLARRSFQIQKPASTADARGGAAAAREAVLALGDGLAAWTSELAGARAPLLDRCRN